MKSSLHILRHLQAHLSSILYRSLLSSGCMTIRTKLPFTSYGWVHDAGGSGERWRHDVCNSGGHVELGEESHYIWRLNKAHTPQV